MPDRSRPLVAPIYERQNGETEWAYSAFLQYRDMGASRTLDRVAQQFTEGTPDSKLRKVKEWSRKYAWVERALAWDDYRRRVIDAARLAEWKKWEQRRIRALHAAWDDAQSLREKARLMLKWPLQKETSKDGKVIVNPVKWSMRDAVLFMQLAAQLEAAATEAVHKDPPPDADLDEITLGPDGTDDQSPPV